MNYKAFTSEEELEDTEYRAYASIAQTAAKPTLLLQLLTSGYVQVRYSYLTVGLGLQLLTFIVLLYVIYLFRQNHRTCMFFKDYIL